MRNKTDILFSLVLPSRHRPYLVNNCLTSFFTKAKDASLVEAIVLCDYDDWTMRNFESLTLSNNWNIKIIFQRQSRRMIHDYNNYGSQCSTGKYVWQLNDDVEISTPHWDFILDHHINSFLQDKPDRILYVSVDDSTHTSRGVSQEWGCCFPLLSKESVDIQNCHMPSEINMWGADIWLYKIYQKIPSRILNLESEIKLLHHCRHNSTAEADDTAHSVKMGFDNGAVHDLSTEEFNHYVNLLSSNIR